MALLASDYYNLLKSIQNTHEKVALSTLPYDSDTFFINLQKREIEFPSSYQGYLSIATDHRAEVIHFAVDRYYEDVDLKNTTIVVEYINTLGEARIYPVTVFDFSDPNYIKFEWSIGGDATKPNGKKDGQLQFAVRFYTVDQEKSTFTYNLNTRPAVGNIVFGMDKPDDNEWYEYPATAIEEVYTRLEDIAKAKEVLWRDVTI